MKGGKLTMEEKLRRLVSRYELLLEILKEDLESQYHNKSLDVFVIGYLRGEIEAIEASITRLNIILGDDNND